MSKEVREYTRQKMRSIDLSNNIRYSATFGLQRLDYETDGLIKPHLTMDEWVEKANKEFKCKTILDEIEKVCKDSSPKLIVLGKNNTYIYLNALSWYPQDNIQYPVNIKFNGIPVLGLDTFEGMEIY